MGTHKSLSIDKTVENVRTFYKLRNACLQLKHSMNAIYELALSQEELNELSKNGNTIDKFIGTNPLIIAANHLKNSRSAFDMGEIFKKYEFDENSSPLEGHIEYPLVTDASLEALAFIHKSFINSNVNLTEEQRTAMCNERLQFVGENWLNALVSYSSYKKYPYANEASLTRMKQYIINNNNLEKVYEKLGFKEKLLENIPPAALNKKEKKAKQYAGCMEAYIGALAIDRFGVDFKELANWIEELSNEHLVDQTSHMEPVNKNAKNELARILQFNLLHKRTSYRFCLRTLLLM